MSDLPVQRVGTILAVADVDRSVAFTAGGRASQWTPTTTRRTPRSLGMACACPWPSKCTRLPIGWA